MFSESADLYDLVYEGAGKDYEAEFAHLLGLLRDRLPGARTLLDVACGTGKHLALLADELSCTGVDLDPGLLAVATGRCPRAELVVGDMRTFDLGRTFDIVTCLFGSVGYMLTLDDLGRAIATMARHVRPGGLLVVETCNAPTEWSTDLVGTVVVERPGFSAVRMGSSTRHGRVAEVELQYLIGSAASGIEHVVEHHALGLFTEEEYAEAFRTAGLAVERAPSGPFPRRILVGRAPEVPA
ncbi:methyltransferase domain-containing protein [Nocardioides zeae]|uniref:Class I SAM-dependent methyltransferase n=1 Tax=Nocardioides zeae TaxID=1457234 RepID=A0A6P0HHS1_9ACTN|nr:class I SAM-dependent methyltransferase [Nocardioides zeae]